MCEAKINLMLFLIAFLSFFGCSTTNEPAPDLLEEEVTGIVSEVDSLTYNLGIPLYNADQAKEYRTEFNTEIDRFKAGQAITLFQRAYVNDNPYLQCKPAGGVGSFGVRMSLFKNLFSNQVLPESIANRVTGMRFNAVGFEDQSLRVLILDANENTLVDESVELEKLKFKSYEVDFQHRDAKEVVFFSTSAGEADSLKFGIDDVFLKTEENHVFKPPASDDEFLAWLKRASFNFFDWNYVQISNSRGVVLESNDVSDKVSLSGMGYAYAIFLIAGEDGLITPEEAKNRVSSMLKWQLDQNWFDGSGGWHGIPHHYFRKDGSALWPDVSTIDWAICAAGIRSVRQFYAEDLALIAMADTLLSRPDWTASLAEDDKIAMGFNGATGEMNDYRWGLFFSEETEIVYLEAVASGDLDPSVFGGIVREIKSGFYPSWFGAGFTYNWLQLWMGSIEPYKTNSIEAYKVDASTCLDKFGIPLMGLTACSTVKEVTESNFMNWNQYISNQGGLVRLTNGSVIQISPAPYGAALALPFTYDKAMLALRSFVELGYYHEYLGLPDNVRLRNLPEGVPPAPNWDPFDINIGPMILAIEMVQENRVATWYQADPDIKEALPKLIASFP